MPLTSQIIHEVPVDQPASVHEVAARLFPAYTIDGGAIHLAGCRIEDRLFARLEYAAGGHATVVHLDAAGTPVPEYRVVELGLDETCPMRTKPTQPFEPAMRRLVEAGRRVAAEQLDAVEQPEPIRTVAVWCKHVEGKLRFACGEATADLPFRGWARTLQPPPFICRATGAETYHLAATDDGRLAAASEIEICQETGRRVLRGELLTCAATGRRALAELFDRCASCGRNVLASRLVACESCGQRVSPSVVERGRCETCRTMTPIDRTDPRVARLVAEYPALERWGRWRIGELRSVYVMAAGRWLKQILLVVDKSSFTLRKAAVATKLVGRWKTIEPGRLEAVLR